MLPTLEVEAGKDVCRPILLIGAEVPQLQLARKQSEKLFAGLNHKLSKASKKVKAVISQEKCCSILYKYHIFIRNSLLDRHKFLTFSFEKIFFDPNFLLFSYSFLKSRKVAPGSDNVSLSNITLAGILKMSEELRFNNYKPKPVRRVLIPKSNGRSRPFGISSSKDKVIQQALLLLVEPFFESIFDNSSYGFRRGRSSHTCLREIQARWQGATWFLEFDVEKMFDRVQHRCLVNFIKKYTNNRVVLNTIIRFLKVGYVSLLGVNDCDIEAKVGLPQGSIISPLLANIYMHELDIWIRSTLIPTFTTFKKRVRNPKYEARVRA